MALALAGVSGQDDSLPRSQKDEALPKKQRLTLDSTGRFLAAPGRVAGALSEAPEGTSLSQHLALLARVCGN
jgi:hypothetical protein